jgi:hypothetical protein
MESALTINQTTSWETKRGRGSFPETTPDPFVFPGATDFTRGRIPRATRAGTKTSPARFALGCAR